MNAKRIRCLVAVCNACHRYIHEENIVSGPFLWPNVEIKTIRNSRFKEL